MKKWYQKSMAVITAAACLFAGGTIGLARDSLPQLQLAAEAATTKTYVGSDGLQLDYEELRDGTIEITRFISSTSTDIELPSIIDGKSVASIGDSSFEGFNNLTSVVIPKGVTNIGWWTFYDCTSLISVTIPESVTSIGGSAFNICNSLTDIYYKGTESEWNQISLGNDSAISSSVTIHYNVPTIGNLEIGKVEVTLDELQANDYKVTVPITMKNNNDGWDSLAFGLSWNTSKITYSSCDYGSLFFDAFENNIHISSSGLQISPDGSFAWTAYVTDPSSSGPSYVVGDGTVINVTFKINANAQSGDTYYTNLYIKSSTY